MGGKFGLLIVLFIILLLFGSKGLRNVGEDLAAAVRSFRAGIKEEEDQNKD